MTLRLRHTLSLFVLLAACNTPSKTAPTATAADGGTPSDAAAATTGGASTASAPTDPLASASAAWPLPTSCMKPYPCRTAKGEPGLSCMEGGRCVNPCLPGMAPEPGGSYCSKRCATEADCKGGRCGDAGVCDFWHPQKDCESSVPCELPDGELGAKCGDTCVPPCKKGLKLYGGTHCAKPCKKTTECPGGGECSDGFCMPLCPAEGCPYRWE